MIFAIPFPLVLFEIVLFFLVMGQLGFVNTLGVYFLPSLLGLLILSFQSRSALMRLQVEMAEGKNPGRRLMGAVANFFAGVFFVVPTFTTRLVALFLIVPGVRRIFFLVLQRWISKRVGRGASAFRAEFRTRQWDSGEETGIRVEKDAKVIDVEPLEIEHSEPKRPLDS